MSNRSGFLEGLFPPKFDFYGMLSEQADLTAQGVDLFAFWLANPTARSFEEFQRVAKEADSVRMKLEEDLIDAFTTPFDREDIYTFSVRMNRILAFTKVALLAIEAYSVPDDQVSVELAKNLVIATRALAKGTALLEKDPKRAGETVETMRKAYIMLQDAYREALAQIFRENDAIEAMKKREVYYEIREVSNVLDLVVDVFHRIIVRLI